MISDATKFLKRVKKELMCCIIQAVMLAKHNGLTCISEFDKQNFVSSQYLQPVLQGESIITE